MNDLEISVFIKRQLLFLKHILIKYDTKEIINRLKEYQSYLGFLEAVGITLEYDKEFFFLQDYLKKTQYIIRLGSEKFQTSGETREVENEYIVKLNKLLTTKDIEEIADCYLGGEYLMREYVPYTDELLFSSIAHDYSVLKAIQEGLDNQQKLSSIDPKQFLASTSYFTYIMPELYENNPECITKSKKYIKQLRKVDPKLKPYAKKVKKRLDLFK